MLNQTEKKQCLEYIDTMIKVLGILIEEVRQVGNFPIDISVQKRRLISSDIVCDCLYLKNIIETPERFVKIQKQINQACDVYLDFYGQLPERVDDDDITWVKKFEYRLFWASRIIVIGCETLSKMQKEKKFWYTGDLFNA